MDYIIGDTQSKPGVRNPLVVIAHHICTVKPQHVIHLGDHWDLPSLSTYDKGTKKHRDTACYESDMDAGNNTMKEFWAIIERRWPSHRDECVFIILEGNHEHRRHRALEHCNPEFYKTLSKKTFDLSGWNIKVPFLEIAKINGVEYSHYFGNDGTGNPISSARALLKRHVSCVAGHKQGFDYAEQLKGKDEIIQTVICGSSYYHNEDYKKHTNHHFRGILMIHHNGKKGFDFARVSLDTLDSMFL